MKISCISGVSPAFQGFLLQFRNAAALVLNTAEFRAARHSTQPRTVDLVQTRLVDVREALFEKHCGLVRTAELLAIGVDTELLRWAEGYGSLIHVRHGWWARPGTSEHLLRAWRAGGRLACVSALAFHGQQLDLGDPLHIELAATSRGPRKPDVIVHWSTDQRNGDRRSVSIEVARRQAIRCRAANGSL